MFERLITQELEKWAQNSSRKPMVIRGARQVGKTTLVNEFAKNFDHYIYLNLETRADKEPFEAFSSIETLIKTLFFLKDIPLSKKGQKRRRLETTRVLKVDTVNRTAFMELHLARLVEILTKEAFIGV